MRCPRRPTGKSRASSGSTMKRRNTDDLSPPQGQREQQQPGSERVEPCADQPQAEGGEEPTALPTISRPRSAHDVGRRLASSPTATAPRAKSTPKANEPWVFTHTQAIGNKNQGDPPALGDKETTEQAKQTRPNSRGRCDHRAAPPPRARQRAAKATLRAGVPVRANRANNQDRPALGPVSTPCSSTQSQTEPTRPLVEDAVGPLEASQLCTTQGSPWAVNEYGSDRGIAPGAHHIDAGAQVGEHRVVVPAARNPSGSRTRPARCR